MKVMWTAQHFNIIQEYQSGMKLAPDDVGHALAVGRRVRQEPATGSGHSHTERRTLTAERRERSQVVV